MIEIRNVRCREEVVDLPFSVFSQRPAHEATFDVIKALVDRIKELEKMEAK